MIKDAPNLDVEVLNLDELIDSLKTINSDLSDTFKQLRFNSENSFRFYRASYSFGDKIISNKETFLSTLDGESISFNDLNLPEEIRNDLSYNLETEDPLGIIINKTSEAYIIENKQIHSYALFEKGRFFGVPRALSANNSSRSSVTNINLNAGSKSLFMLAKISESFANKKLSREFGTNIPPPQSFEDHWSIFTKIAKKSKCDWKCEIIFFSRDFIKKLRTQELAFIAMNLNSYHSDSYNAWHNITGFWSRNIEFMTHSKLLHRYNHNLINITKHIFMLSANSEIGFKPANDDEQAPISTLQKIYREIYGAKNTTIMVASQFNYKNLSEFPVYVSLTHQSKILGNMEFSGKKSNLLALNDIASINKVFRDIFLQDNIKNAILSEIVKLTSFDYFHSHADENDKLIQNSANILIKDPRFIMPEDSEFPATSSFFSGCIRVSRP